MELSEIRERIDAIDADLLRLFCERLDLAREVAAAKAAMGRAVFDPARERAKLHSVAEGLARALPRPGRRPVLPAHEPEQGRAAARARRGRPRAQPLGGPCARRSSPQMSPSPRSRPSPARASRAPTARSPRRAPSACPPHLPLHVRGRVQGGGGRPHEFGVLPIENSTAGSVNAVYDLLATHSCRIVRSVRVKVDHNLLARPGTRLEDVHEVWSHEQALNSARATSPGSASPRTCARTPPRPPSTWRKATARTWPRSPRAPAQPSTASTSSRPTCRTPTPTTPGSSSSPRPRASIPGRRAPRSCSPCRTNPARSTGCWSASTPSTSTS